MSKRLNFSVPHPHSHEVARQRVEALGEYFRNRHGASVTWRGDAVAIVARYLLIPIEATAVVGDTSVDLDGRDPGMLMRGKATSYLRGKLETYLDPATPLDQLPRA